jgi:hypothetical protein
VYQNYIQWAYWRLPFHWNVMYQSTAAWIVYRPNHTTNLQLKENVKTFINRIEHANKIEPNNRLIYYLGAGTTEDWGAGRLGKGSLWWLPVADVNLPLQVIPRRCDGTVSIAEHLSIQQPALRRRCQTTTAMLPSAPLRWGMRGRPGLHSKERK